MSRCLFLFTSLLIFSVSCISQDQFEPTPTVPSTDSSTIVSTPALLPRVTALSTSTMIPLYTPSISGEESRLVFFISEQGKFTAWIPIAGDIVEYTITRTFFGESTECSVIVSRLNSAGATVQYCDLTSTDIASLSDKAIIQEVRDAMKSERHLTIDYEEMSTGEDSFPALTLSGTEISGGNPGTFKARIILAGNYVYIVHMYVYQTDWCYCRH